MPLTWNQLLSSLRLIISEEGSKAADNQVHRSTIIQLLKEYKASEQDFKKYIHFDDSGYTKNLVEQFDDNQCNIIVMCWAPNQSSAFHGHEGSKCFVKVLSGQLLERKLPYPDKQIFDWETKQTLEKDSVTYIDDSIGIHQVVNESSTEPAITLHVYLPAYLKCKIFNFIRDSWPCPLESSDILYVNEEKSQSIDVTFHSKFGDRQQFD